MEELCSGDQEVARFFFGAVGVVEPSDGGQGAFEVRDEWREGWVCEVVEEVGELVGGAEEEVQERGGCAVEPGLVVFVGVSACAVDLIEVASSVEDGVGGVDVWH